MRRARLLACAGAALVAAAATGAAAAQAALVTTVRTVAERPVNVILVLADDLGVEALGSYGGQYPTPNLDRLAREGVSFENAHATPLCSPTRTRLMTGIENGRNYQAFGYLSPKARTFAHLFKAAGYATAVAGKWQLSGNGYDGRIGATPRDAGFDDWLLWQLSSGPDRGSRYWGPTLAGRDGTKIHESGFGPDYLTDYALDFIGRNRSRPFFLYFPTVLTHAPFVPTPAAPNATSTPERFAAMVRALDDQVGAIVARVEALGLSDRTLIVFTGDNGTDRAITSLRFGHTVRGEKGMPTLSGTHVPLIFRWKGVLPAAAKRTGLFDVMDMTPTLAALTGAQGLTGVDGVDQSAVVRGAAASARSWIFQHYAPMWKFPATRFIFDRDWKLYGDGRFVALDADRGLETAPALLADGSVGRRRRGEFAALMARMGDGPLSRVRFPWCRARETLTPGKPAVEAGCAPRSGDPD
jgi:arylsulfatase A